MKPFRFEKEQFLARPLSEVFAFFSDAKNLQRITPDWLHFQILSLPQTMGAGALIHYKLRVRGLPLKWTTRIETFDPPHGFTDIQLRGPYRMWHHSHEFRETSEGTWIKDIVDYELPIPWGAKWVNRFFVAPDLNRIFEFRAKTIEEIFTRKKSA